MVVWGAGADEEDPNLVDGSSKFILVCSGPGISYLIPRLKEIRTKEEGCFCTHTHTHTRVLTLTFDILDLFPFNFNMLHVHDAWRRTRTSGDACQRWRGGRCNRNRAPSSLYAIYIVPLHLGLIPGPPPPSFRQESVGS